MWNTSEYVTQLRNELKVFILMCKALDFVRVVRCRDCAYICKREYANGFEYHTCSYFDSEHAEVEPDGFCAWGERRNGDG